ncbi:hypothetical protein EBS67_06105 [bacterium]|nr:hypothetical protein [bacterium]
MELKLMLCRIFAKCLSRLLIACVFATFLQHCIAAEADAGKLVSDAHSLIKAVKPEDTSYIHKNNTISWGVDSKAPLAKHYHDAIIHHRGFKEITKIDEVRPGDIIAIKYPPGSGNTGHVMLVAAVPLKRNPTEPLIKNSIQYEIEIIDSTSSGHGASVGHTWSVYPTSKYYEMTVRNLVIGRINP